MEIIGLDLDDSAYDYIGFLNIYGKKYFDREPFNSKADSIEGMFQCTQEESLSFWTDNNNENYIRYYRYFPAKEGMKEVVDELYNMGYMVRIITKRINCANNDEIGEFSRKMVSARVLDDFKRNDMAENIFFEQLDNHKADTCEKLKITKMIDDNLDTVLSLSEAGKYVICFANERNLCCKEMENVFMITNPLEIPGIVKKIEQIQTASVKPPKNY